MQTVRWGRSRWQRQIGAVGLVAAGAILLASCSSGPSGVNAPGPPVKAPGTSTHVKTVQFPSGPVPEHIYGPSWARFVAAFPGKVTIGVSNAIGSCAVGSRPQYDATAGTPLTPNVTPPSYNVLVFRCATATEALSFVQGSLRTGGGHRAVVNGVSGLVFGPTRFTDGSHKTAGWAGNYVFRTGRLVYAVEPFANSRAAAQAFLHSFHFDLAGYTPAS